MARKLILCVIDALSPPAFAAARRAGMVPTLAALCERGRLIDDCLAAFPSVTPVCAGSIATGYWQDAHGVPGMCWYDRREERFIEYGSSFRAAQQVGIARQLTDTIYNLNRSHLNAEPPTLFERLDDAGLRTAGTTYLIYRGRHRHEPRRDGLLARLASPLARHDVLGPRELFYADIFASRKTPCTSLLGMPGMRDRHSGCVSAYMVENDLFDFLLLSLPDNDWHSHKRGPDGQTRSLKLADAQLQRVVEAAGGLERFLERYAVIVLGDHGQTHVRQAIDLRAAFEPIAPQPPAADRTPLRRPAICPSQRAAMVYLPEDESRQELMRRCLAIAGRQQGIELACHLAQAEAGSPEAVLRGGRRRELRFAPGDQIEDARGGGWSVEGNLALIGARIHDGVLRSDSHPDALARLWAALSCTASGDILLSAAPGGEFLDIGGQAHVGGGSHGSLHAADSLTSLLICGLDGAIDRSRWRISDAAELVYEHFQLPAAES